MKRIISATKQSILNAPVPSSTNTYKAISHGKMIDLIEENIDKNGLKIVTEEYISNFNSSVITGYIRVTSDVNDNDISFGIAFMNSYDKSRRAVIAGGSKVRVCTNGHILGTTEHGCFTKKHVGKIETEIDIFIPEMVKTATDTFFELKKQKDKMKEIGIDKKTRNELIGQLYLDEALISDTQMSIIRKEIQNPSFNYGTDKNTVWDVYNHITCGLRTTHPSSWISTHQEVNKIFADTFSL